jgi:hypothetical protein
MPVAAIVSCRLQTSTSANYFALSVRNLLQVACGTWAYAGCRSHLNTRKARKCRLNKLAIVHPLLTINGLDHPRRLQSDS